MATVIRTSFWVVCDVCEDSSEQSFNRPADALQYMERGDWQVQNNILKEGYGNALCPACASWAGEGETSSEALDPGASDDGLARP